MSSNKPLCQFAYRSSDGVTVISGEPEFKKLDSFGTFPTSVRKQVYSPDGSYLATCSGESVKILNASSGELVQEIPVKIVLDLAFSPKGTYLSVFERYTSPDPNNPHRNLVVYKTATQEVVASFTAKNQNSWALQWTESETLFARLVSNEVQFFDPLKSASGNVVHRLKLEGMADFAISPGMNPAVAAFVPEKKGQPAHVYLYSIPNFSTPVSFKSFFRADTVQFHWNELGTSLLVLTSTEVDATNKSYYGETSLYYLSLAGNFDCRVTLDKPGPIHHVAWNPSSSNSKEFVVVYGSMPAKTTLFDHRANPVFDFGSSMRNFVTFNPQGRIIVLAGFGNLAGEMDFWDRSTLKKIGSCQASNASVCNWSPCGRFVLTATVTPRLRVDNGYKLWHYTGTLVHHAAVKELYNVVFRPFSKTVFAWPEKRALSPAPNGIKVDAKEVAKPMGKYRPPGARGTDTPSWALRRDEATGEKQATVLKNNVPGAIPKPVDDEKSLSKAALKNKKKREAKKRGQDSPTASSPTTTTPPNGVVNGDAAIKAEEVAQDIAKKVRNLQKKLRQIQDIKKKVEMGETVELNQLEKLKSEDALVAELKKLSV